MSVHQLAGGGRLAREELRAELERARERIADLEGDRGQSHERLIDSLAEHLQDGFVLLSPEGVHLDVNPALCAMVGYTHEELVGVGLPHPYWPPEERQRLGRDVRRRLEGETGTGEVTFMRKCGERFPVLVTPSVIRDEAGKPVCVFATIKDISERRRAERELRQSEEKFAAAFHACPDLISITRLSDGRLLEVNEAYSRLLGYTRAESIGKTTSGLSLWVDLADRATLVASLEESGQISDFETTLRRKDGTLLTCVCSARIVELEGETCFLSIVHDITERKQAEEALRESEARYRSLFEDSPIAMWEDDHSAVKLHLEELLAGGVDDVIAFALADPQEYARCIDLIRVVNANKAAVRLFEAESREDLLARNSDIYRNESEPGIWRLWQAMLAGERSVTFEEADRTLTGKDIEVLETCTVVPGHEQTFDRVYLADVDISEQQRAAAELEASAAQVRQALAATVAALSATTELRDPYTAGHQRRVAELAGAIAAGLGWDAARIEMVTTAGLLHDVGKIVVPAEILARPGRLSELEMDIIRGHAAASAALIAGIEFGGPVAAIVNQHHERLDGSGYPQGLRGENILPEARILAVADVVEAMSSHRPYRPALDMEAALAEVREHAGAKYDAEVVASCVKLVEEQGFQFTP